MLLVAVVVSFLTIWPMLTLADTSGQCNENNPWSVRLGNSYITLNNDFTATIKGSSNDNVYGINIARSRGVVTQGNRAVSVIVNVEIPRTKGYNVYNIIGVDSLGLLTGRAYCTTGGGLTAVWLDDTSNPVGIQKTTTIGTCNITRASQTDLYQIPNDCLTINPPPKYPSLQGAQISLQNGQPGSLMVNQNNYTLLPFNVIDCKNCGDNAQDGWVEIHSLLTDGKPSPTVCMAILYLYAQFAPVALSWLNCFEQSQPNATFDATYDIQSFSTNSSGTVNLAAYSAPASSASSTASAPISSDTSNAQSSGLSTGAKIGIGVGVPLAVLLVAALVCAVLWHRRRRTRSPSNAQKDMAKNIVEAPSGKSAQNGRSELDQEYKHLSPVEVADTRSNIELSGVSHHQLSEMPAGSPR